jgi:hypothetical protein
LNGDLCRKRRGEARTPVATGWLMMRKRDRLRLSDTASATLDVRAYQDCLIKKGKPMTDRDFKYPSSELVQRVHDVLLVSSFALWAMLIGFVPLAAYRLLVS